MSARSIANKPVSIVEHPKIERLSKDKGIPGILNSKIFKAISCLPLLGGLTSHIALQVLNSRDKGRQEISLLKEYSITATISTVLTVAIIVGGVALGILSPFSLIPAVALLGIFGGMTAYLTYRYAQVEKRQAEIDRLVSLVDELELEQFQSNLKDSTPAIEEVNSTDNEPALSDDSEKHEQITRVRAISLSSVPNDSNEQVRRNRSASV
jgi:hypothetical protein